MNLGARVLFTSLLLVFATTAGPSQPPQTQGPSKSDSIYESDFPFPWYIKQIQERISYNWSKVQSTTQIRGRALTKFNILRNGDIIGLTIETSSCNEEFDQLAMITVKRSSPFPLLPVGYDKEHLVIHFWLSNN